VRWNRTTVSFIFVTCDYKIELWIRPLKHIQVALVTNTSNPNLVLFLTLNSAVI